MGMRATSFREDGGEKEVYSVQYHKQLLRATSGDVGGRLPLIIGKSLLPMGSLCQLVG